MFFRLFVAHGRYENHWRNVSFEEEDSAAAVGSFSLMKWLREKGVPWDAMTCCEAVFFSKRVHSAAAAFYFFNSYWYESTVIGTTPYSSCVASLVYFASNDIKLKEHIFLFQTSFLFNKHVTMHIVHRVLVRVGRHSFSISIIEAIHNRSFRLGGSSLIESRKEHPFTPRT